MQEDLCRTKRRKVRGGMGDGREGGRVASGGGQQLRGWLSFLHFHGLVGICKEFEHSKLEPVYHKVIVFRMGRYNAYYSSFC